MTMLISIYDMYDMFLLIDNNIKIIEEYINTELAIKNMSSCHRFVLKLRVTKDLAIYKRVTL